MTWATSPPEGPKIPLPQLTGYHCFGCGTANAGGLHMKFYRQGHRVCSDIVLGHGYEGWQNMAHGGIISTVLDEIIAWTVIAFEQTFFVTRRMTVEYLRPVPIGAPLLACGELLDTPVERGCAAQGAILDADHRILATARAELAYVPKERLHLIPEPLKIDMEALFDRMATSLGDDS